MAWFNMNGVIGPDSIDPDSVISDLPFTVLLSLSEYLNIGDNRMNWRAVIAQIPEKIYSDDEVETIALSIHEYNGSPALKLLRNLGSKGRSVRQLISYLDRLGHEKCLKLIKRPENIRLLQVPLSQTVESGSGTVVVFTCKARGFPFPHYRWYQAFGLDSYSPHNSKKDKTNVSYEEVAGATDRVLKISPVRKSHAGAYCCQVYHKINDKIEQVFTDWAYLRVYPPAKEDEEFLESDVNYQQMRKPQINQQPPVANSVRPGKSISVVCLATGCPPPKYQWYKFGNLTQSAPLEPHALRDQQKETLYWAQSTAGDEGMYQCRVWNEAGCVTSKTVTITVDSRLPESYPDKIMIQHQPESVSSRIGEQRFLSCRAKVTEGNLFFQWYLNSQEIPGATLSELHFLPVKPEDGGMYQCCIRNDHVCVWSNQAILEIIGGVEQPVSEFKYFATDKVALLIGNQDYRSNMQLIAPELDVEKLAVVLSELDFKVISLLNLNLQEMNFALSAFCDLLNSGVYGLFYFSGHGFANDGQSYMIPVDAAAGYSTHECICDQYVLDQMQNRNTALNVILLDICRKSNNYPQQEAAERYEPEVRGNTVFGYAAQINTQAWEAEKKPYAFFTKYLIQRIKQKKRVTHMLEDVIEDVCNDPDLCDRHQYPAICQDLREPRTLLDPINPAGHTEEINSRSRLWGSAHLLPEMPIWMEFEYGVCVCIDIKTRFSNVLVIYSYIPITGNATNCTVKLENFTSELDIKMENQDQEGINPGIQITKTTVRNLQRLRGDMESTITVEGEYQGERFQQTDTLVVTRPLVSKLWQTKRYAIPSETVDD